MSGAPAARTDATAARDGDRVDDGGLGGTLYVVATPIGNLGDVTLRALEILRSVPLIAAEDTRMTRRLLVRHGITTQMVSYHARSGAARADSLLAHLRGGADLALVSDAGTPVVSDPGEALVAAWAGEGGAIVALPGASAVLVAVVASGLAGPRWAFEGFLPRRGRERRARLARIAADERGSILFEAPSRVGATLRELAAVCGDARPGAVCRELTKLHEQVVRGSLASLVEALDDGTIPARGEFAIVVGASATLPAIRGRAGRAATDARSAATGGEAGPWADGRPGPADALAAAQAAVERLVADGTARGDAARRVSAATGIPRRQLYGRVGPR